MEQHSETTKHTFGLAYKKKNVFKPEKYNNKKERPF